MKAPRTFRSRSAADGQFQPKVFDADITTMRGLRAAGFSRQHIARRFDIHPAHVSRLLKRPHDESYLDADESYAVTCRAHQAAENNEFLPDEEPVA